MQVYRDVFGRTSPSAAPMMPFTRRVQRRRGRKVSGFENSLLYQAPRRRASGQYYAKARGA